MAVTIKQLREMATRLPDTLPHSGCPYVKVPYTDFEPLKAYRVSDPLDYQEVRYNTVEFRAKETKIDGCKVLAWYHGDILVRVCC